MDDTENLIVLRNSRFGMSITVERDGHGVTYAARNMSEVADYERLLREYFTSHDQVLAINNGEVTKPFNQKASIGGRSKP